MAKATSYLTKRGNTYLAQVKVPRALRPIIGKAHLRKSLGTDSLARANALKHRAVAELKEQLAAAGKVEQRQADGRVREALEWRQDIEQAKEIDRQTLPSEEGQHDLMTGLLADRAQEIEDKEGSQQAKEFHAIATGQATPISALVEDWLLEKGMKPRQVLDYRRAVTKFTDWLTRSKHPVSIEKITRKITGAYITDTFIRPGVHPKTANKDISAISSLWRWSERKGHVDMNPWSKQSLQKPKASKSVEPRAFTDQELTDLFTKGAPSVLLRDAMSIAALSGMRVQEVIQLTVGETRGGVFNVTDAKTAAGIREVPIHSALNGIIERRTKDKKPTDPLFPECPEPKPGSATTRSDIVVKRFVTHRRNVGVDDTVEGARQSRTTFHSFRRTVATKAEQAGHPKHLIEALLGHEREGMSLGLYSAGPSRTQLRAVVESIALPEGVSLSAGSKTSHR
jgi:integrase